jgi:hypothetical protein
MIVNVNVYNNLGWNVTIFMNFQKLIQLGQLGARHMYMSRTCMAADKKLADYANLKVKQAKFQASNIKLCKFQGYLRLKDSGGFSPRN